MAASSATAWGALARLVHNRRRLGGAPREPNSGNVNEVLPGSLRERSEAERARQDSCSGSEPAKLANEEPEPAGPAYASGAKRWRARQDSNLRPVG